MSALGKSPWRAPSATCKAIWAVRQLSRETHCLEARSLLLSVERRLLELHLFGEVSSKVAPIACPPDCDQREPACQGWSG